MTNSLPWICFEKRKSSSSTAADLTGNSRITSALSTCPRIEILEKAATKIGDFLSTYQQQI